MAGLFEMLDEHWLELEFNFAGPFTTQTFRSMVEENAPEVWAEAVRQYGPGGAGSGKFYSPANILYNYLDDKARKKILVKHGKVSSTPGWGASWVMQWELAAANSPPPAQEDVAFIEGKQTLRSHLVRERAVGLRSRLLNARRKSGLSCDMCGITGASLESEVRDAMFEAHHATAPLALTGQTKTTVEDLSLLCASCHRLIHRLVRVRDCWFTISEARDELGFSPSK